MTKLDLYVSANKAAMDSLDLPDGLALEQKTIADFTSENLNTLDWTAWKEFFYQTRMRAIQLKTQDAPSVPKPLRQPASKGAIGTPAGAVKPVAPAPTASATGTSN